MSQCWSPGYAQFLSQSSFWAALGQGRAEMLLVPLPSVKPFTGILLPRAPFRGRARASWLSSRQRTHSEVECVADMVTTLQCPMRESHGPHEQGPTQHPWPSSNT